MYYGLSNKEFALSLLLLIYILGPFNTPHEVGYYLKTPIVGLLVFSILIYLFYNSHIALFGLYIFAVYELLNRLDREQWEDMEEEYEKFRNMKNEVDALYNMEEDLHKTKEHYFNMLDEKDIENFNKKLEGFENDDYDDEDEDDIEDLTGGPERDAATQQGSGVDPSEVQQAALQMAANIQGSDNEINREQEAMSQAQSQLTGGAEVQEAFTQALGYNSLENEMINRLAPVGEGSIMKYKSTPYVSSASDLKGASLL
jgi:hypothetical protein